MSADDREIDQQLVHNIDEALRQCPTLTDKQADDVGRLRAQVEQLCLSGKYEEAERSAKLALMIVRAGSPAPE